MIAAVTAALGAALVGCGTDGEGGAPGGGAAGDPLQPRIEAAPGAYHLGDSFEGLPLAAVLPPPQGPGTGTTFVYGDCEVPPDPETGLTEGGCPAPLEIQTWSICERPPSGRDAFERFRGALARWGSDRPGLFSRHEVYTGRDSVAIFANDPDLARRAAEQMWPAGGERGGALPAPPAGTAQGRLGCGRR